MASARLYHRMAVLDGKLYAVGGCRYYHPLSSVERYDPALDDEFDEPESTQHAS